MALFRSPRTVDAVVAGTATLISLAGLVAGGAVAVPPVPDVGVLGLLVALGQGVPLYWRRRQPFAVALVVAAFLVLGGLVGDPNVSSAVGGLVAAHALGAYAQGMMATATVAGLVVVWTLAEAGIVISTGPGDPDLLAVLLTTTIVYGAAHALGIAARRRREAAEALAREAVSEERVRIARELHDVVAHHVGVMVIQAGAGRRLVATDPQQAGEVFAQIERSGREALTAMPVLLGALRGPDDGRAPQPTLDQLPALVARLEGAGLRVALDVDPPSSELPPALAVSAYRIVQEALTNVARHAGPARAEVSVRCAGGNLEVQVADDGRGPSRGATDGFGITGMRERAALLGGSLEAGPRPEGGFAVRAVLPLGGDRR